MQQGPSSSPEEAVYLFATQLGRLMRRRQPGDELDVATWPVLYTLQRHGALRLSDLAAKLQLDASTVSRHVKLLDERQMVERTGDPEDRRAALVRVTDAGEKALEQGRQRRRDQIARVLEHWPRSDVQAFAAFARRFSDDLNHMLDEQEGGR